MPIPYNRRLPVYPKKVDISTGDDELWDHAMATAIAVQAAIKEQYETCCVPEGAFIQKLPDVPAN